MNTPLTGQACGCRPGVARDNCPTCEGGGMVIDFRAIHRRAVKTTQNPMIRLCECKPLSGVGLNYPCVFNVEGPHIYGPKGGK